MTRLDRKEYKCNHCGAVTVISDTDAERLESLLKQMLAQRTSPRLPLRTTSRRQAIAIGAFALIFFAAVTALRSLNAHHGAAAGNGVDAYFQKTTVPVDRVVMSPLEWVPDGDAGSYNGLIYNHSGYPISPPFYNLELFHGGVKDGGTGSTPLLGTLEPGEYMPVSFRVDKPKADTRYEVVQPSRVDKSTFEIAPVKLEQPILVRQPHLPNYYLVGFVQNTLKRPFSGGGMVMLYDRQGRLIGSGVGNIGEDLNPGEKTKIVMNAWAFDTSKMEDIGSYEYLMDMRYKNERQSVSEQDLEELGSVTVPNRIVRVSHPQVIVAADSESMAPAAYLHEP